MEVETTDMSEVATLPVSGEPRTHITLSVEALAERLALAEEVGFSSGLIAADLPDHLRIETMMGRREEYARRVRLFVAQLSRWPGA